MRITPKTLPDYSLGHDPSCGDVATSAAHGRFLVKSPWKQMQRAAPSVLLRSALFTPQSRYNRFLVNEEIASNRGVTLCGTGTVLSMLDEEVWMLVCHLAREGDPVRFKLTQFIRDLGRARGGNAGAGIRASLERLSKFTIALDVLNKPNVFYPENPPDAYHYHGRLIDTLTWRDGADPREPHDWDSAIELNPALSVLFEPRRRTIFDDRRLKIGHNPVALWIYGQIRSHKLMLPLPPKYFHRLSRSKSTLAEFTNALESAFLLLRELHLIHGGEIRNGKVFVQREAPKIPVRTPSAANDLGEVIDDEPDSCS
jgi:hypothetical protein